MGRKIHVGWGGAINTDDLGSLSPIRLQKLVGDGYLPASALEDLQPKATTRSILARRRDVRNRYETRGEKILRIPRPRVTA